MLYILKYLVHVCATIIILNSIYFNFEIQNLNLKIELSSLKKKIDQNSYFVN